MPNDGDEIVAAIQGMLDQQEFKTIRELLRDYPHVPGIRLLAGREYAALQDRVEASSYVRAFGWNSPTGRPREGSML